MFPIKWWWCCTYFNKGFPSKLNSSLIILDATAAGIPFRFITWDGRSSVAYLIAYTFAYDGVLESSASRCARCCLAWEGSRVIFDKCTILNSINWNWVQLIQLKDEEEEEEEEAKVCLHKSEYGNRWMPTQFVDSIQSRDWEWERSPLVSVYICERRRRHHSMTRSGIGIAFFPRLEH